MNSQRPIRQIAPVPKKRKHQVDASGKYCHSQERSDIPTANTQTGHSDWHINPIIKVTMKYKLLKTTPWIAENAIIEINDGDISIENDRFIEHHK